jgi:hypothetical protein
MPKKLKNLLTSVGVALKSPTLKQREAYGRWTHTLSAAATVGAVTVMFGRTAASDFWYDLAKVGALFFWSVILFIAGAILSKGD